MRRFSRRELLGLGAAAGLIAASPRRAAGSVPERGGSLRLGLGGRGIGPFDGRIRFDPVTRLVGHGAVFDCLTEIGADGAINGELATGWESSADGRVWKFFLRRGVRFHDGSPFGSDDVIATLRRHVEAGAAAASPLALDIEHVRRLSDDTVQIALRKENPGLPFLLADPQLVILPAGNLDGSARDGIGTGLYRLESGWSPARAVLHRVPSHYKDGRAGWFDRLEVLVIPEPGVRREALLSGRVDAINLVDPAWVPGFRRMSRIAVKEVSGNQHISLTVEGVPVREAQAIRRAVAWAIDRKAVVASVLHGMGEPGADDPLGPACARRTPIDTETLFDPARARDLVRSAGLVGRAVGIDVQPSRVPGAAALSREVVAALHRSGLTPASGAAARLAARVHPGRPTEDWSLRHSRPSEPEAPSQFDRILDARSTSDRAKRRAGIAELNGLVAMRAPIIIPAFAYGLIAYSTRLAHPEVVGLHWDMDSARIAERWWTA